MNKILTVTKQASTQLKKIIDSGPSDAIGVIVGIDKTGCNGYSYKLNFAKAKEVENAKVGALLLLEAFVKEEIFDKAICD